MVSHESGMDDWEPDEVSIINYRRIYFWVVPANVEGSWSMQSGSVTA